MSKTYLIFRHEFFRAIKKAGFIVITVAVPVAALVAIGILSLTTDLPAAPAEVVSTAPPAEGGGMAGVIVPGVFSLLLALALMLGSTSLISGLAEEKESRLIEVLFSSVSIRQLLVGKVLALGSAGLLQVVVWLISLPLLLDLASSSFGGFMNQIQIPANFVLLGIVYFVLGYLLFAVLSIGLGAISSSATEGGQLSMIYTLTSFVPLWIVALLSFFPESPIWVILSIFPITAPIQVMLRLGVSTVPVWQIVASIGVLGVSIVAGMIVAIKVFRLHMLSSGKRPSLKEIARGLREA